MRKILFLYLRMAGIWHRFLLILKRKTVQELTGQRMVTGKAWAEFCDQLKIAGNVLLSKGTPRDPFQQAEGIRYLSRLTRAGLEAYVEYNDPRFPELRRMVHETVKMGADNPDNLYLNAQISGSLEYRIHGERNTVDYISFHTQNGNYGTTGGLAPCWKIENHELVTGEDGSFEIFLSREPKGSNWLKIEDNTTVVMVRQTFADRRIEVPAKMKITCVPDNGKPGPLTPEHLDEGLKSAAMLVGGAPLLFTKWANGFKKHMNTLPQFDTGISNAAGGDETIIYYHSCWKLDDQIALIIEVDPPACDNWNFQLNNYWMESLDYRFHNICINRSGAVYEPDGMVRIVVSHQNPGLPNWIETAYHNEGTMCWRWYRIHPGAEPVEPRCRVVPVSELNNI